MSDNSLSKRFAESKTPRVVIRNAIEVKLNLPDHGHVKVARVQVTVTPASGAVLLYGGPDYIEPKRFDGPQTEGTIETSTQIIYAQLVSGAESANVKLLGHELDDDAPLNLRN